jgi:5-methylcytosine-specific restriction endonuclease McrA
MRQEFSAKVKAAAFLRADGFCEGIVDGERCGAKLTVGKFAFDHVIADGLTGEPTLSNCAVLCLPCHSAKTPGDVKAIAKAKRIERKHRGIKKKSTFACSRDSRWKKKINGQVVPR